MTKYEEYPFDYTKEFGRREKMILHLSRNPEKVHSLKLHYKDNPLDLFRDWFVTIDPRNVFKDEPSFLPFLLWKRQRELVEWFMKKLNDADDGLIEKSRDGGVTWIFCGLSIWLWLFYDDVAIGWGSRKQDLVDKKGDPKSIFEKIRSLIYALPEFLIPVGFKPRLHDSFMKIINPENGASIAGEAGDNIGRGGRTLVYFKDESAHYQHAESIEASLSENTNIQIDFSSVNGSNNVFYRKRMSGKVDVFIMDWRDDPRKTLDWYKKRKEKYEAQGIGFIFAQEIDRDYTSAVEKIVIPGTWARACIDAHKKLDIIISGRREAGLDVADEGGDINAYIERKGILVDFADGWGDKDTSKTAIRAWAHSTNHKVEVLKYDSIGVGAGVKGKTNELVEEQGENYKYLSVYGWNAGGAVRDPFDDFAPDKTNFDMFENVKAQEWWYLRQRFYKTYKMLCNEDTYPEDELISIDGSLPNLDKLLAELSQPTYDLSKSGKLLINKRPEGTTSPNYADACVIAFAEVEGADIMGLT